MRSYFRNLVAFLGFTVVILGGGLAAQAQCVAIGAISAIGATGLKGSGCANAANSAVADAVVGFDLDEFPVGRIRETWHQGLKADQPASDTGKFRETEASVFGSYQRGVAQPFLSGELKLGAFAGYAKLNADFSVGAKAAIDAYFFGGTATQTWGATFVTLSVGGVAADVDLSSLIHNSYGLDGVTAFGYVGHVFDLSSMSFTANTPLKLSVKGGLSYVDLVGSEFLVFSTADKTGLIKLNGIWSAKFYSDLPQPGGELARPYLSLEARDQFRYDNFIRSPFVTTHYTQADVLLASEAGVEYRFPTYTVTGSVYGELAGDRSTIGARLGAHFQLN